MTPSDKAEAERRYPDDLSAGRTTWICEAKRAAYIAGREAVRAAIAASGPAAGMEAIEKLAWRFQSIMGDHLTVDASDNEIMETGAASYAMARLALAASPPPAPAGERERVMQLVRDESWRREYPTGVVDARRKTFIAGAEFALRALTSEAGPAEGER